MALTAQSMLAKATIYRNDIINVFNKETPTLAWIPKRYSSGKLNISWKWNKGGATAFAHAEGADFSTYDQDVRDSATLSWKEFAASFGVTGLAQATAQQGNPFAGEDPGKTEVLSHCRELGFLLNTQILTGSGLTTNMSGMGVAIANAANTYAGVNRATEALWRPYVIDPGSATALTKEQFMIDQDAILDACGQKPDTIIVTPAVARKIRLLWELDRQIQTSPVTPGVAQLGVLGYSGFQVEGMNVIVDRNATANSIYYVNSNHIWLEILNTYTGGVLEEMAKEAGPYANGSIVDVAPPLLFNYEKLAKTGDSEKGFVKFKGQLVVDRPNTHGARLNVSVA